MKVSHLLAGLTGLALAAACSTTPEPVDAPKLSSTAEKFTAALAGGAGITTTGNGSGEFTFTPETKTLAYTVSTSGLTGPATSAHIHGPADPGATAGVVVPFTLAAGTSPATPITGSAMLTDTQIADLRAGKYYVNVHTAKYPAGEIRGQITPVKKE